MEFNRKCIMNKPDYLVALIEAAKIIREMYHYAPLQERQEKLLRLWHVLTLIDKAITTTKQREAP